jgi:hypothetical protein
MLSFLQRFSSRYHKYINKVCPPLRAFNPLLCSAKKPLTKGVKNGKNIAIPWFPAGFIDRPGTWERPAKARKSGTKPGLRTVNFNQKRMAHG